jgi:hypothetical protein
MDSPADESGGESSTPLLPAGHLSLTRARKATLLAPGIVPAAKREAGATNKWRKPGKKARPLRKE